MTSLTFSPSSFYLFIYLPVGFFLIFIYKTFLKCLVSLCCLLLFKNEALKIIGKLWLKVRVSQSVIFIIMWPDWVILGKAVILQFIIRHMYLVFLPVPGTELPKPLEFPEWWKYLDYKPLSATPKFLLLRRLLEST